MFAHNSVTNGYLGPSIYGIARRGLADEIGEAFIVKAVKDLLHVYSILETHRKNPMVAKPQPLYFGHKGNSSKLTEGEVIDFTIKEK